MSRASDAANAVVSAVLQACALYHVPALRMQSLPFMVPRASGGFRPICIGKWTDLQGEEHNAGMADVLAMPNIPFILPCPGNAAATVPLWIECKAGSGRLTDDQKKFRDFILSIRAHYLLAEDCADAVFDWFIKHGVRR